MKDETKMDECELSACECRLLVGPLQGAEAAITKIKVHYIDVGQGDAIYIKMPSGEDIVIDGGNKGKGNELVAYMKKQKVGDIEVLISTHPDSNHIGGLDEVLDSFKVKSVYAPKVKHTTQAYKDFLWRSAREADNQDSEGGRLAPVKGVKAQFVGPVKDYAKSDLNNWSAVLHVAYKKKHVPLHGRCGTEIGTGHDCEEEDVARGRPQGRASWGEDIDERDVPQVRQAEGMPSSVSERTRMDTRRRKS